jgi:hypothetical protein
MVCALLAGRKTQTRRIIKPQPLPFMTEDGSECEVYALQIQGDPLPRITLGRVITRQELPIAVGDRLWVRESVKPIPADRPGGYFVLGSPFYGVDYFYRADGDCPLWANGRWHPSIHMPKKASRLTLIVTDVRVQRLQDISRDDAIAEGLIKDHLAPPDAIELGCDWTFSGAHAHGSPKAAYAVLWNKINGPGAWEANPFVAAYTFAVHRCNIDQMEAA